MPKHTELQPLGGFCLFQASEESLEWQLQRERNKCEALAAPRPVRVAKDGPREDRRFRGCDAGGASGHSGQVGVQMTGRGS